MTSIEIKRGYEVLPDNNVRFGIRIANTSDVVISDVEVILDYSESLFKLEGERVQKVGNIPPSGTRTAEFVLKPLGCVHQVNIEALISYRDTKWEKHIETMRPKEVHCVCPFLKGKAMPRGEFLELSNSGHSAEMGLNFKGINVERLASYLVQTCKSRHYKVDDYSVDGGRMLYLASESIGEKAYYLLTALIKEEDGLTQVMLRVASDKSHGLNGFLNETVAELRHVVSTVQSAQEIGIIKNKQVINIIDSIVQRSNIGGSGGGASVNIKGSVVQRTEFNAGEDRKVEEERLREREEQERLENEHKEKERKVKEERERKAQEIDAWQKQKARDEQERITKKKSKSRTNVFMLAIVLGALFVGFGMFISGSGDTHDLSTSTLPFNQKTYNNSIDMEFVLIPSGEFDMGSPSNEIGRSDNEGPVHEVRILDNFYMGKYEVTQKQWSDVMGSNPSYNEGDDLPVERVSWDDVQEFIRKLNEKEGTDKYRLPSEAEWEYVARAGTTTRYSFGDDSSKLGEYAWYVDNSDRITHPVGQKRSNPWGLYDMSGNVMEWVQDEWHDDYDGAPSDGSAWESGVGYSRRVIRSGSENLDVWYCRSAFRYDSGPADLNTGLGFRLLKEFNDTHDFSYPQGEVVPELIESTPVLSFNQNTRTNSIGMEFVQIPAGEFYMGLPSNEIYLYSSPVHHVTISNEFYMGKYEVTQNQWLEVMGTDPSYFKGGKLPVEKVSWVDVQEFIRKLNDKEGTDKYRLPSEAEWEYAARAGTTTIYSFGDDESKLGDYAWYGEKLVGNTHPVGNKKPNYWGLYDMYGNVFEWVQDEWHVDYDGAPSDGSAWEDGNGIFFVFRGGSWDANAQMCGSANRGSTGSGAQYTHLGFRLLQEP